VKFIFLLLGATVWGSTIPTFAPKLPSDTFPLPGNDRTEGAITEPPSLPPQQPPLRIGSVEIPQDVKPIVLPANTVFATINWAQNIHPPLSGSIGYAHWLTGKLYSYSAVRILSVSAKPFRLGTTQETGACTYTSEAFTFHLFLCGSAGAIEAAAPTGNTNVGFVAGGTVLATKDIGRGWWFGISPSVTKPTLTDTQFSAGLVIGWGQGQ
jgi:hypothetical protein